MARNIRAQRNMSQHEHGKNMQNYTQIVTWAYYWYCPNNSFYMHIFANATMEHRNIRRDIWAL